VGVVGGGGGGVGWGFGWGVFWFGGVGGGVGGVGGGGGVTREFDGVIKVYLHPSQVKEISCKDR